MENRGAQSEEDNIPNAKSTLPMIYTIGHSTRTLHELIELLRSFGVDRLVDIRAIPYSRHNPQFNRETMERSMPSTSIDYEHLATLGGIPPARDVMEKARSCSERSRGFASYMETPHFIDGIRRVLAMEKEEMIALMCAENDPTHCHRWWVADALVAHGAEVEHIIGSGRTLAHQMRML